MMLKCLKYAAFGAAVALAPLAAHADEPNADTVVATVNGTDITLGHVIMVRAGLPEQYLSLPDETLWTGIIDQLVQQTVLAQTEGEARSKRLQLALENEERALRASQVVEAIASNAASDAAIQAVYEAEFAKGGGREYNAAHILVATEEEAAALVEEARGGANFAKLAQDNSTGPSGPNGGDLGWFGEGMMVAPFEAAVKELEAGAISDPVQTQFGWHVIRLNETRIKDAPPLDEVRAQIEQQIQSDAVEGRLNELVSSAEVTRAPAETFDISLMKNLDLLEE
ncbi:peptidylprolyl isomerase [Primorskyibacter sp. S187A]|uniref:peptidylprolyl isomerase n=1 Tax=Primorskyibacter sp. S187A TaxID=3415130 RepID=UPI003C7A1C71